MVDDPPNEIESSDDETFATQLWNYAMLLSYILDPKYYNKFVTPLRQNRVGRIKVNGNKFFSRYHFQGKEYYGECFDYRLIKDLFQQFSQQVESVKSLFNLLTEKLGKTKFFICMEESILTAINKKDKEYLERFQANRVSVIEEDIIQFLDRDGILIVKSTKGADKQLEKIFPEEEVEKRVRLYQNYIDGVAHQCKAPCTSRGIEGKPCEKMTFRDHCYFHR